MTRQRAILQHLADPAAYESTSRPPAEELRGIDAARLRVLGRLILAKRMAKIASLLPATCRCVSLHAPALTKLFAAARPPASLGRWDNALQFHDFVVAYDGPGPGYLPDLARFELALARARVAARDRPAEPPGAPLPPGTAVEVRRAADLQVFETRFDLRAAQDGAPPAALEPGRLLRVAIARHGDDVRVFQVEDEVARVLSDLEEWTRVDAGGRQRAVVESLAGRGLVEVRACASAS